jgi:uncharacterized protein YbjT (DUF2867 family)
MQNLGLPKMGMKLVISGASGKTGYRIAEEAVKAGHKVRLLVRSNSKLPDNLANCEQRRLSLGDANALDAALDGFDALIIATGARPSPDLTGPARVDAIGVKRQIASCKRVGLKRVVLVSSLCAGRWQHPLNLFGLILVWKRVGERALEQSDLDWTVIRPGGLNEREENLNKEGILYTTADSQENDSIPRRLVARCCIEALGTPTSIGRIVEITSNPEQPRITMKQALINFG